VRLPEEPDNILKFKNFHHKIKAPFIIYTDLECLLNPKTNRSNSIQEHIPCSIGYYLKCVNSEKSIFESYRDTDCIDWFCKKLNSIAHYIRYTYNHPLSIQLTEDQQITFSINATICHICETGDFNVENPKVRDHCHITGQVDNLEELLIKIVI